MPASITGVAGGTHSTVNTSEGADAQPNALVTTTWYAPGAVAAMQAVVPSARGSPLQYHWMLPGMSVHSVPAPCITLGTAATGGHATCAR